MLSILNEFRILRRRVETLLREDRLEEAIGLVIEFIETHLHLFKNSAPRTVSIEISASISRLSRSFSLGLIEWKEVHEFRGGLIKAIIDLLDAIERMIEEAEIEKRSLPHIGALPPIFSVKNALEEIERLLIR